MVEGTGLPRVARFLECIAGSMFRYTIRKYWRKTKFKVEKYDQVTFKYTKFTIP